MREICLMWEENGERDTIWEESIMLLFLGSDNLWVMIRSLGDDPVHDGVGQDGSSYLYAHRAMIGGSAAAKRHMSRLYTSTVLHTLTPVSS